ncbi:protein LIAT1 [Oryzias melastigma]|uniref:protein LIAT1 n=1 Tax=Oryzias melastigma TaxID=30732 RepID=UPI000CF7FF50|nr:protein LIAT1 [Oryzias melastigma]
MTNPEDTNFKFTQTAKVSKHGTKKKERKGKKKQKRINGSASTTPENKDKQLSCETTPLLRPQEPVQTRHQLSKPKTSQKKNTKQRSAFSQKSKTHQQNSRAIVKVTDETSGCRTVTHETGHRESLRWEGVLQDPQEEAKRLEQYRADRRQRYIAHREALLKETQQASREAFI